MKRIRRISIALVLVPALLGAASPAAPVAQQEENTEVRKIVLAELFTGSECPPCAAADRGFDRIIDNYSRDEVVVLEYHLNIPRPDPMATQESSQRAYYYMGPRQSTPRAYFDGGQGISGGGSRMMSGSYFNDAKKKIKKAAEEKPVLELRASATNGFSSGLIKVALKPLGPTDQDDLRLHLVFYEDEIHYRGSNGVSVHRYVARKMVDGPQGLSISLAEGELTVNKRVDRNVFSNPKIGLVAFVQEQGSRRVLQAQLVEFNAEIPSAVAVYNEGIKAVNSGSNDEAIKLFAEAVEIDPTAAIGHLSLGMALAKNGKFDEALLELEEARDLEPEQATTHYYLSLVHENRGRIGLAIDHLSRFLALAPDNPRADSAKTKLRRLKDKLKSNNFDPTK